MPRLFFEVMRLEKEASLLIKSSSSDVGGVSAAVDAWRELTPGELLEIGVAVDDACAASLMACRVVLTIVWMEVGNN